MGHLGDERVIFFEVNPFPQIFSAQKNPSLLTGTDHI